MTTLERYRAAERILMTGWDESVYAEWLSLRIRLGMSVEDMTHDLWALVGPGPWWPKAPTSCPCGCEEEPEGDWLPEHCMWCDKRSCGC